MLVLFFQQIQIMGNYQYLVQDGISLAAVLTSKWETKVPSERECWVLNIHTLNNNCSRRPGRGEASRGGQNIVLARIPAPEGNPSAEALGGPPSSR